jgi:hypothetical protein
MSTAVHDLQDKLVRYLTDLLSIKDARMATKIEIEHAPQGCRAENVKEWSRETDPEMFDVAYVERFAADMIELAEQRADVYRMGENIFKVRVFQLSGRRTSYPFKMLPVHDGDESALLGTSGTGDANATGVLVLQMRNNEFLTRTNRDMMVCTITVLQGQVKDLLEELREVRAENRQLIKDANANKAEEATRELAVLKQAHQEGRKDQLVGKVVSLLPVVAASVVEKTKGAGAAADSMLPMMLTELGTSLLANPAKMAHITQALSAEERIQFGRIMQLAKAASDAQNSQPPTDTKSAPSSNGVNGTSANAT